MSIDYGERICVAIDEIISKRIEGLSYDITKTFTIVDNEKAAKGIYTVTDGTLKCDVNSDISTYSIGDRVLVTIPNGDYSMPKVIAGRDVTSEDKPFKYISPMDSIIPITDNLCDTNLTGELLANDSTIESDQVIRMENGTVTCLMANLTNSAANSGLNRLCISADFRSYLRELGAVTGQYGLKVLIHNDEDKIYELILNCADMYGNPYQFDIEYNQSKIFDIYRFNPYPF